jgi:energy-coupling factor transporter ATP-binding protein EcfA2
MSWLLEKISIEGFRGINNAQSPLELKFHSEKVNSVFAPNGVGKSSIFEALKYALTGAIPKLDQLPAAERGPSYYLNRFHPSNRGVISLTVKPLSGSPSVTVTVVLDSSGKRSVVTSDASNGDSLLAELNREFVLLDATTFEGFIDDTPLERGRSFSGLLGLGSYSALRQALQAISNTRTVNTHFDVATRSGKTALFEKQKQQALSKARESYIKLVGQDPKGNRNLEELASDAHVALKNIPLLSATCDVPQFHDVSPDACIAIVKAAEGGAEREQLSKLIQEVAAWTSHRGSLPKPETIDDLVKYTTERDAALAETQGELFLKLHTTVEQITSPDSWGNKNLCPACDRIADFSVLERARDKAAPYKAVVDLTDRIKKLAAEIDWHTLTAAEAAVREQDELLIRNFSESVRTINFTREAALQLRDRITAIAGRIETSLAAIQAKKNDLESRLPASLVAVTERVEAARQLQTALKDYHASISELGKIGSEAQRVERVKSFVSISSKLFAKAEAEASERRLAAVEPVCRAFFDSIMFEPVVPAIAKPAGSEELRISLSQFYELKNISAPSVLSESYRNAFAISVYLAAAALYGGTPRFLVLDDVTSSLDAGHQFHLMELIRTKFSRPLKPEGPQVIILSHDTLLEKYFNRNGSTTGWWHQRIEGNPRTAVLPQSNAVNRVKEATLELLKVGNTQDAAPRIRQYLEYSLEEIITRCRIPVPMDLALTDDKRLASHLIDSIESQVKLHAAAGNLVLEQTQVDALNLSTATIVANFLSHWSSGQAQAFSAGALTGVMQAISSYTDCFKFEPSPGAAKQFYRSLSQRT